MGCITGFIAKILLTAFNAAVALAACAVLSCAAIITSKLSTYGDLIPQEPQSVLDGLMSMAGFVICLGLLGVLTVCCCSNKLFMWTYSGLGICMVIIVLTFAIMGEANINSGKYNSDINETMYKDITDFKLLDQSGDFEKGRNAIYYENKCCGVDAAADWKKSPNQGTPELAPNGCCDTYAGDSSPPCILSDVLPSKLGCHKTLSEDVYDIAKSTADLSIFFGIFLLALITSTIVLVKCTDALPI